MFDSPQVHKLVVKEELLRDKNHFGDSILHSSYSSLVIGLKVKRLRCGTVTAHGAGSTPAGTARVSCNQFKSYFTLHNFLGTTNLYS